MANRIHAKTKISSKKELPFGTLMEVGPRKYIIPCEENEDSDKLIDSWLTDKPVYGVSSQISDLKPPLESENY